MNQNEIINYICSSIKDIQNQQKEIKKQNRIADFEKQYKTTDQLIKDCAQRFANDLVELISLCSEKMEMNNANQTK